VRLPFLRARPAPAAVAERPQRPPLPGPPPPLPDPAGGDPLLAAALELCWRSSVLLTWGDAPRVARFLLLCRAAGARRAHVACPDLPPDPDPEAALRAEAAALELPALAEAILAAGRAADARPFGGTPDVDAPRPWWLRAAPDAPGLREAAGFPDLVVDGSQLVHAAEPVARLRALAATGARRILLETPVVTAAGPLARAGFRPGDAWHAHAMSPAQSAAMAEWWRERGVALEQYRRFPQGFTRAQAEMAGLGATAWWSFMDRIAIARMLGLAGLRPRIATPSWEGRSLVILAEPAP